MSRSRMPRVCPRQAPTEEILFAGRPNALVPAGAPLLSDPVDLPVKALASLSISLYLPEETGPCTCHSTACRPRTCPPAGFHQAGVPAEAEMQSRAFLSGVEVASAGAPRPSSPSGIRSPTEWARQSTPTVVGPTCSPRASRHGAAPSPGAWSTWASAAIAYSMTMRDKTLWRASIATCCGAGGGVVIVFEGVNDLGTSFGNFEGPLAGLQGHDAGCTRPPRRRSLPVTGKSLPARTPRE